MKHDSHDLDSLLDDVLPDAGGPDRATLLTMVREERARRRSRRLAGVAGVTVLLFVLLLTWHRGTQEPATVVVPAPPPTQVPAPTARLVIQEVDDRQFLALLEDAPVALMEWPNGERTLLVMHQWPRRTAPR